MAGFEYVEHDLWEHKAFRKGLTPTGKALYLWAWTNGRGRLAGAFTADIATASFYTGLSGTAILALLGRPGLSDMLRYYPRGDYWWCVYKAKRCRGEKQVAGCLSQIRNLGQRCPIARDFARVYGIDPMKPPKKIPDTLSIPHEGVGIQRNSTVQNEDCTVRGVGVAGSAARPPPPEAIAELAAFRESLED